MNRKRQGKCILEYKKGNAVLDSLVIVFFLMAVLIASISLMPSINEVKDDIVNDYSFHQESKDIATDLTTEYNGFWDNTLVFIFAMLWFFGIISAFFIDSHPIFFLVAIILLFIVFYVTGIMANETVALVNEGDNADYITHYSKSLWIMEHMVEIVIVMSLSFSIVLYSKFRSG